MGNSTSSSDLPIYLAGTVVVLLLGLTQFFDVSGAVLERVPTGIFIIRLVSGVVYLLIVLKFLIDEGVASSFRPDQGFSQLMGEYGGPLGSFGSELLQIVTYTQVSKLLLIGITRREWDSGVSGANYWLFTIFSIILILLSVFLTFTRATDLRNHWGNMAEVVDGDW